MDLSSLKYAPGSRKSRKRVGRGNGSGHGTTSGRGTKGYLARSGSKHRPWMEGGTMPIYRRLPKRGFTNIFKKEYQIVNVNELNTLRKQNLDPEVLFEEGLIDSPQKPVKVLGGGALKKKKNVTVHAFSKSAKQKIEKAGGKAEVI